MDIKLQKLKIFTDGGARGNPGPAACGVIIKDENDKVIGKFSKYLGERTNNQAEYEGVILALTEAQKFGQVEIAFYLDSLLVVNQLKGSYKVKEPELQKLFVKIWNLSQKFKKITYTHVPRAMNALADRLVNEELDKN